MERMSGRRVCEHCGASYHLVAVPPKVPGVCDSCGGKLIQRHDDEPETVKHRLEVYHKETEPLKDFYAERGLLEIGGKSTLCGGHNQGHPQRPEEMSFGLRSNPHMRSN